MMPGWPQPASGPCVITINALSTDNTYSPPRALVALDEAGMSNPCGLDAEIQTPNTVPGVLLIPPGNYSGVAATIAWGDGDAAECYLAVESSSASTIVDATDTGTTPVSLAVGSFTVSAPYGRVYVFADFTAAGGSHTIDPSTVITITKET